MRFNYVSLAVLGFVAAFVISGCSQHETEGYLQFPAKPMPPTFTTIPRVDPRNTPIPPPVLENDSGNVLGDELWQKRFISIQSEFILGGAVDLNGDIYLTGWTDGNLLSGGDVPGLMDAFLRKIDSEGKTLWITQFGSHNSDDASSLMVDHDGNIVVVGKSRGDVANSGNQGGWDAFLYKFDQDGNEIFRIQFGLDEDQYAKDVAVDSVNNIYVVGRTKSILDQGIGFGGWDGFLMKFDSNGNEIWSKYFGGIEDDFVDALSIDLEDNIFLATTKRTILPTPLAAQNNFETQDFSGLVVTKIDTSGEEVWTMDFGTALDDDALTIETDFNGNIFLGGQTRGAFGGFKNQGRSDAFVAKLNSDGLISWINQFGYIGDDYVSSIDIDIDGNIYAGGKPSGPFKLYDGRQPGLHAGDAFIRKFSSSGETLWVHGYDSGWDDFPSEVMVSKEGEVYITGFAICIDPTIAGGESPGGSDPQPPIGWISSVLR
jgi:hypothetical protein